MPDLSFGTDEYLKHPFSFHTCRRALLVCMVRACVQVCMRACVPVCVWLCVWLCVCVCVCLCVCVCARASCMHASLKLLVRT
jgi:hypothetical protein